MSIERLQAAIREKKTPVALGLAPEIDKVPAKILKNFEDMFGPGMMANAEALRFHGCQAMDAAQGKLPAVVISAEHYLRYGMMGADVLSNLTGAASARVSTPSWTAAPPARSCGSPVPWWATASR